MSSTPSDSPQKNQTAIGVVVLFVAIFAYGGLWPVMRMSVDLIPPFWFATARVFIGSILLFILLATTGRFRFPPRTDLPIILSVGICMMGLYVTLVHYALQFVPAGRGALLAYSTPLWVTPVAVIFLGAKLTALRSIGLVMGLSGLGFMFNPAGFDWSDPNVLIGNGMCVLAAMIWSVAILHMRRQHWTLSPLQLAPWQLLVATIVTLPFTLLLETRSDVEMGWPLVALVAYGGVIGTGLGIWAVTSTVRYLGPVTASVGMLGGPVFATTISVLFLGEMLTWTLSGGFVLIIGGIALVTLAQARTS
ncbi:MAG: DMT family transporter [Rhodospirillaceae bacterium]|nr:DMT family transporter [Rhodospirillaceae bacterium]MBT5457679.1 DMT family transporter [Rhodospirillaceae bacterium]